MEPQIHEDFSPHGDQNGSFHMGSLPQKNGDGITEDGPCDHILPHFTYETYPKIGKAEQEADDLGVGRDAKKRVKSLELGSLLRYFLCRMVPSF